MAVLQNVGLFSDSCSVYSNILTTGEFSGDVMHCI